MDSPQNDKWGFVLLKGWFVGCTGCTLQTLYALASERFVWLYGWNPYL